MKRTLVYCEGELYRVKENREISVWDDVAEHFTIWHQLTIAERNVIYEHLRLKKPGFLLADAEPDLVGLIIGETQERQRIQNLFVDYAAAAITQAAKGYV